MTVDAHVAQQTLERSFTDQQQAAIAAAGSVAVFAAAGSGKTTVMVQRIVNAVVHDNVSFAAIIAVTFTRAAAAEIRRRIADELVRRAERGEIDAHRSGDLLDELEAARCTTIDALCAQIVRRFGVAIGVDPAFRIVHGSEYDRFCHQAARRALAAASETPTGLQIRSRIGDGALCDTLIALARHLATRLDQKIDFGTAEASGDAAFIRDLFVAYREQLAKLMQQRGCLSHDDVKHTALALLRRNEVRVEMQSEVQFLLVDEYQDTNEVQDAILQLVGGSHMFCVGDVWQSIYGFRGAEPDVFQQRLSDGQVLKIDRNFRCRPPIVNAVNAIFGSESAFYKLQAHRPSANDGDMAVQLAFIHGDNADEARFVARHIAELVSGGARPRDIAILLPTKKLAPALEDALAMQAIESVRTDSSGFANQQQIRDLRALLQWLVDPRDVHARLTVLASPMIGCTWEDLARFAPQPSDDTQHGALIAAASERHSRATRALGLWNHLHPLAVRGELVELVDEAVHGSGYFAEVLAWPDGLRRYANMRKLIELAADAQRAGVYDVTAFEQWLVGPGATSAHGETPVADDSIDAVKIMTIHASKGLEFGHVIVAGLASGGRADQIPGEIADGKFVLASYDEWGDKPSAENDPRRTELRTAAQAGKEAEMQRLLYVAMTRAKETLVLSGQTKRKKDPKAKPPWSLSPRMRFLVDRIGIDFDDLTTLNRAGVELRSYDPHDIPHPRITEHLPVETAQLQFALENPQLSPPPAAASLRTDALVDELEAPAPLRHLATRDTAGVERRKVGERLHARLAQCLTRADAALPAGSLDHHETALIEAVVATPTFARLVQLGAQAEVPVIARVDGEIVSVRFDVLAHPAAGEWWIVDYKTTAPSDAASAWARHGEQFQGYIDVAHAAGAQRVQLTMVPLDRPTSPLTWRSDSATGKAVQPDS